MKGIIMNKPSEKAKEVEKKISKIRLHVHGEKSTIYRNDGLPFIDDKTDAAVKWLNDNGFKKEDIEIVGKKPEIWDIIYPLPVKETEVSVTV